MSSSHLGKPGGAEHMTAADLQKVPGEITDIQIML